MRSTNGSYLANFRQKQLSCWLLLCFLVNVVAPAFADAGYGDGRVLVCTASGLQWINVDGQPTPSDLSPTCVFCLNTDSEIDLVFYQHLSKLIFQRSSGLLLPSVPEIGFSWIRTSHLSRGPPSFS